MTSVSVLEVLLYGEPIGTLTQIGGDRTIFAFNDDYIADSGRPVLGLGFKNRYGELLTEFRPYRTRTMPFFSNLLPEARLRDYLAERAGVNPGREFHLLWALGEDLPGAITVRSADGEEWPPEIGEPLDEDSARERDEKALRFSLAGVQLKFSALESASGGLTIPAKGIGGSWIVKLPSERFRGVPENEFSMMSLARKLGMNVPAAGLVNVKDIDGLPPDVVTMDGKALAIERFDRLSDGSRVHTEDFAQIFGVYPEEGDQGTPTFGFCHSARSRRISIRSLCQHPGDPATSRRMTGGRGLASCRMTAAGRNPNGYCALPFRQLESRACCSIHLIASSTGTQRCQPRST